MPKIEDAPKSEEIVETEVIETPEEQSDEDRVDALEKVVLAQGEQIADIAEEQEKIVDILEKISDKLNSEKVEMVDEEPIEENSLEEQVENDISEESSEKESEGEEPEVVENIEVNEINEDGSVEATVEGEEVTLEPADEETKEAVEELKADEAEEKVENSITEESEVEDSEEETEEETAEQEESQEIKENKMTQEEINALKEQIKNEILDEQVKAPEVEETEEAVEEPEVEKNWRKRYNDQIAAAWNAYRLHSIDAAQKLAKINRYNFEDKQAKMVKNDDGDAIEVMTIETADDFVLPYEVDRMIHGKRTNYSPLLNAVEYQTTDRLTFAYATRIGDIDMQNVALCDDGEDGNLKPISTYELKKGVAQMEEMAAVTPICDNATKYLAVDILADVAAGYRNDYDRKLAQLVVIRMQQAVNATGNTVEMEGETSIEKLVEFIKATTKVSDDVVNGKFVFNAKTKAQLVEYLFSAAAGGELGKDVITTGEFPTIFGYPYVVVPNDLMPTLGEGDTKSFKATNNETGNLETVTISSPVFYGDLDEFCGKVSGGLKYDVSAEAAYEIGDGTVRSAWQRNELVLRGSFLRGGYIANQAAFAGLTPASN